MIEAEALLNLRQMERIHSHAASKHAYIRDSLKQAQSAFAGPPYAKGLNNISWTCYLNPVTSRVQGARNGVLPSQRSIPSAEAKADAPENVSSRW